MEASEVPLTPEAEHAQMQATEPTDEVVTTTADLSFLPDLTTAAAPPLRLGLDTINVSALSGLQFYWLAGYVGGWWPTLHPMVLAYPGLAQAGRIFSYAVNAGEDADFCDCEAGDLTVAQVPGWLTRQFARGSARPGVYASWDTWSSGGLMGDLAHYGSKIRRIVAHYTFVPEIVHPGFDCQQYTDHYANRDLDGNVAVDSFFETVTQPAQNPFHYDWFPVGPFPSKQWGPMNERLVVEEYDGARKHPEQYKTYLPLLESKLKWLAGRVWSVAHHSDPPDWALFHRGWRWQQLIHRAHGMQFVR